ncbi:MAG TPA: IS110 family transposase [Candidatus Limnocylindrales bacterium]
MRAIGLDIHRGFCEVAIAQDGRVRPARRIGTEPAELEAFATSLEPGDVVTLEATGNAMAIARILAPHARVVLANPKATKAATRLRAKTDRIDARTLAQLLASGFLPDVWQPDETTAALRRQVSRRAHLVKQRTKAKNQVHAALIRNLVGRPPASDLFGRRGRAWLAGVELPADERNGVEASLRAVDFLDAEVARLDVVLAAAVLGSPDMRRLMTLPGVSATTAATLAAVVGDIGRFPTPGRLVAYLGLDPRVSQSGEDAARHGRISKQGASVARQVLVEAAWVASRTAGPLRAFTQRVAVRRGWNVAITATARKLAVVAWHLLSRQEEYAYGRPSRQRAKVRVLELRTGAESRQGRSIGLTGSAAERRLERERAEAAEAAYRRLVADRTAGGSGAGDASGARISRR